MHSVKCNDNETETQFQWKLRLYGCPILRERSEQETCRQTCSFSSWKNMNIVEKLLYLKSFGQRNGREKFAYSFMK